MNKFLNRLLFIGFTPILFIIITISTMLLLPYWLITGEIIYNTTDKINDWWWELKTK